MIASWTVLTLLCGVIPAACVAEWALSTWTYRSLHARIEESFALAMAEIELRAQLDRIYATPHAARTRKDAR